MSCSGCWRAVYDERRRLKRLLAWKDHCFHMVTTVNEQNRGFWVGKYHETPPETWTP